MLSLFFINDHLITILKYVFAVGVGVGVGWVVFYLVKTFFRKGLCKSSNRLDGKVVLVTGGNAGIGLETARELARRGASVVIASRDERKSAACVADIVATTGNKEVHHRPLDLASFASVRRFAADFARDFPRLDILVNNAGCIHTDHRLTEDGINSVMQINHFGPFLLTHLLLDTEVASKPSRIVVVSSLGHKIANIDLTDLKGVKKVSSMRRYANSKLCNILMTKALAKKLPEEVTVNALHPGAVETEIMQVNNGWLKRVLLILFRFAIKTPVEGCQTTVHLCVSDEVAGSGGYYSDCAPAWHSRAARDEQLIEQVYQQSKLITGLKD